MARKYKNSIPFEEYFCEKYNTKEDIREYLNFALDEYLQDGDFNVFYRSLELCIKAQDSISGFAKKIDLSAMSLYNIVNGKKEPRISTLAKILNELDLKLRVA